MTDVTNSPDLDVSRSAEAGDMLLHVDKECYAQICTCEEKQISMFPIIMNGDRIRIWKKDYVLGDK